MLALFAVMLAAFATFGCRVVGDGDGGVWLDGDSDVEPCVRCCAEDCDGHGVCMDSIDPGYPGQIFDENGNPIYPYWCSCDPGWVETGLDGDTGCEPDF